MKADSPPPSDIFRRDAVEHHSGGRVDGEVLLVLPTWTQWIYWLLLILVAAAAAFVTVGRTSQYAGGPAVIRALDRVALTSAVGGTVATVLVRPGQRVTAGDPLVLFHAVEEEALSLSTEDELRSAIVRMLAHPLDQEARRTVASLRAQHELQATRASERQTRAPEAGIVGDVRVRPGQRIAPGDLLLSIGRDPVRFAVVVLLPGHHRPQVRPGQALRLELTGYPYVSEQLHVDHVDEEVIGPQEAHRMLGPDADAVTLNGPVVAIHAVLPRSSFVAKGREYAFHAGMPGVGRVRLGSERIVTAILPAFGARGPAVK